MVERKQNNFRKPNNFRRNNKPMDRKAFEKSREEKIKQQQIEDLDRWQPKTNLGR